MTQPEEFLSPKLPILFRGKQTYLSAEDRMKIVLTAPPSFHGSERPSPVENIALLIDRRQLTHPKDWVVHNKGSFKNFSRSYTMVSSNSKPRKCRSKEVIPRGSMLVTTIHYRHMNHSDFRRRTTVVESSDGEVDVGLLEYFFDGDQHPVTPKLNSRGKPFVPICASTKHAIAMQIKNNPEMDAKSIYLNSLPADVTMVSYCELPRNPAQVKMKRSYEKKKTQGLALNDLLDYQKIHPGVIQNLTLLPSLRFVYCPTWLLEDVIAECSSPTSRSVFSIDTTHNVGNIYVTTSTFRRRGVTREETNETATFPGPALFHMNKTPRDFFYFASTLLEVDDRLGGCMFIGGDLHRYQSHFLRHFTNATFIPCFKNAQDKVRRELANLELGNEEPTYMNQIFGPSYGATKCLVDSECETTFETQFSILSMSWDPAFTTFFEHNIKPYMKSGMLAPIREFLRIGYFENCSEDSTRSKLLNMITERDQSETSGEEEKKENQGKGGFESVSVIEVVEMYSTLILKHSMDLSLSLMNKGSYSLHGDYQSLLLTPEQWNALSPEERRNHLARITNFYTKPGSFGSVNTVSLA